MANYSILLPLIITCILLIQLIIALLLTPLILAVQFPAAPLLAAMVSMSARSLPQLNSFNPMATMKSLPLLKIGFGVLPFLMVKHFIMQIWMEKSIHLILPVETRIGMLCSQMDPSWRVCFWRATRSTLQVNRSKTGIGTLVALDREGKTVWDKNIGGKLYTTPVNSGDLILVAPYQAEFALAAYDAQGKQAWSFTPAK